jgi:hypothetical protein
VSNILSGRKGGDDQGGRLLTGIEESFAGRSEGFGVFFGSLSLKMKSLSG